MFHISENLVAAEKADYYQKTLQHERINRENTDKQVINLLTDIRNRYDTKYKGYMAKHKSKSNAQRAQGDDNNTSKESKKGTSGSSAWATNKEDDWAEPAETTAQEGGWGNNETDANKDNSWGSSEADAKKDSSWDDDKAGPNKDSGWGADKVEDNNDNGWGNDNAVTNQDSGWGNDTTSANKDVDWGTSANETQSGWGNESKGNKNDKKNDKKNENKVETGWGASNTVSQDANTSKEDKKNDGKKNKNKKKNQDVKTDDQTPDAKADDYKKDDKKKDDKSKDDKAKDEKETEKKPSSAKSKSPDKSDVNKNTIPKNDSSSEQINLKEYNEMKSQLWTAKLDIRLLQRDKSKLTEELESAKQERDNLERKLNQARQDHDEVKMKVRGLTVDLIGANDEIHKLNERIDEMETEKRNTERDVYFGENKRRSLENKYKTYQQQIAEFQSELSLLKEEKEDSDKKVSELSRRNDRLEADLSHSKNLIRTLKDGCAFVESQAKTFEVRHDTVVMSKADMERELIAIKEESSRHITTINKLQKSNQQISNAFIQSVEAHEQCRKETEFLREEYARRLEDYKLENHKLVEANSQLRKLIDYMQKKR